MAPTFSTFKAFDLIVTKGILPQGSVVSADPLVNNVFPVGTVFEYIWLYTKGRVLGVETTSGATLERVKNDCTLTKPFPQGEWRSSFVEDTEILCISPYLNPSKIPLANYVAPFVLLAQQSVEVPKDAKLFIGSGEIQINERTIAAPTQIRFSSGTKQVTAKQDTYGFYIL